MFSKIHPFTRGGPCGSRNSAMKNEKNEKNGKAEGERGKK